VRKQQISLVVVVLALGLALAACGKSTPSSTRATSPSSNSVAASPAGHIAHPAGTQPSISAKMICQSEAEKDIADLVGVQTTKPLAPTWVDHVYSCTYQYANGSLTLSVKELANKTDTDAYFASMATKYGKIQPIQGLGQGAFVTTNHSAVVRKDYKVLLVDISRLPAQFGNPPDTRADVALNVAATIMGCWTGA